MKYAVSLMGVDALRIMADTLMDSTDIIADLTNMTRTVADQNADTLGPHSRSLECVLDTVKTAMKRASHPALEVAEKLDSIATIYEEIMALDPFKGADGSGSAGVSGGNAEAQSPDEIEKNMKYTPINHGTWSGDRGNSMWIPNNSFARAELEMFGAKGISYKNGLPDFTPFSAFQHPLDPSQYTMSDYRQKKICCEALNGHLNKLAESLGADLSDPTSCSAFRDQVKDMLKCSEDSVEDILEDLKHGVTPDGYTWHHTDVPGVMQLVPEMIHGAARHRGGRSIWGGGYQCRYMM